MRGVAWGGDGEIGRTMTIKLEDDALVEQYSGIDSLGLALPGEILIGVRLYYSSI